MTTGMRRTGTAIAAAIVTIVSLIASPSATATPRSQVTDLHTVSSGRTATGGWIAYTGSSTRGAIRAQAAVAAGGGVWSYGSYIDQIGRKVCYSQYWHPSRTHSASVVLDAGFVRESAPGGATAYASVARWTFGTCYAYWNV